MLSNEQRLRLEKDRDSLQEEWDIRNDKLTLIRKGLAIETDTSTKFKYEQQIKQEENELKKLTDRLDEIEKQLQSASSIPVISEPERIQQKILILTAIPHGLRLDREIREIEEAIKRSTNRDLFEIKVRTAVRPQDIRHAIAEEQPQIVHFCGHGLEDGSLLLKDDAGNNKPIKPFGLASLFNLHTGYVKCVLLNVCYSEKPAMAISQHIDYVIGMNNPIQDSAAIKFAQGFYDGLGYKNSGNQDSFQRAFDEGIVAIKMENLAQALIPVLQKKTLNEHEIKELSGIPVTGNVALEVGVDYTRLSAYLFESTELNANELQKDRLDEIPVIGNIASEVDINYTELRNLLKKKDFWQADKETTNIILEIANREEEGWLREEDIKNIYIRDLYTIDQLWLTSSNEKFGFSIQKKIWMELCENRDVDIRSKLYDKYKIFKLFLKKVEWNEDNKKIKITFHLRAKEGHLPLGLYVKTSNNAKLHQKYERTTESIIYSIYGYPNTQLFRNTDRYNFFLESVVICFSTFGSVIVLFVVMLISQIPCLPSMMICLSLMLIYLKFYFSVFFKNDGQREQEWDMKYIALLSRKDL